MLSTLKKDKEIHFIGIGGAGMSGLARVLLCRGYRVAGSDVKENFWTRKLSSMGGQIFLTHNENNISESCQCLVISTAIRENNPELVRARNLNIPVLHRSQMLDLLVKEKQLLTVAGTHGKTTTSSMLTAVYEKNGLDPMVFIGAELDEIQGNAKDGLGPNAVIEADESDGSFLNYSPHSSIITNIDEDHLDFYGNYSRIQDYFLKYIENHDRNGCVVLCGDDQGISELKEKIKKVAPKVYYYGLNDDNDFIIRDVCLDEQPVSFDIYFGPEWLARISLLVPGLHNIYNAAAVFALSWIEHKVSPEQVVKTLSCFRGAQRRFQIKGEMNDIIIIDDYGHHPREIDVTVKTAVQFNKLRNGRLFVIFQPHRYSRTHYFLEEFSRSFKDVDFLYVMDIYSAGEESIPDVNSRILVDKIITQNDRPRRTFYSKDHEGSVQNLYDSLLPGDTVLTIGAGDVYRVGEDIFDRLRIR